MIIVVRNGPPEQEQAGRRHAILILGISWGLTKTPGGWKGPVRRALKNSRFAKRQNTPSTIAPTKANARYTATTLSLLAKVTANLPWYTSLAPLTRNLPSRSRTKKVSLAALSQPAHRTQ
jgi:hypothetical protein